MWDGYEFDEGTTGYRAPEQYILRHVNISASTDIFALGQVGWFLVAGRPRELNENFNVTDWDWDASPQPMVTDIVPGSLVSELDRATAFRPGDRHRNASEFAAATSNALGELDRSRRSKGGAANMSMSRSKLGSVPFWPDKTIPTFNHQIPILFNHRKPLLADERLSEVQGEEAVIEQLSRTDRSWFRPHPRFQDRFFVVAANYSFQINIGRNRKLWATGIRYVANEHRRQMIAAGVQIRHRGIVLLTPREMRQIERESTYVDSGAYVRDLVRLIEESPGALGERIEEPGISEEETNLLEALQTFVDAEFELEERAAQQEPGFYYRDLEAVSRRGAYRQFYEVELDPEDHRRMLELRPSMLAPSDEMGLPSDLRFEVTDLQPDGDRPLIRISIERQTQWFDIPREGQLLLSVFPTLKKVRTEVLEAVKDRSTANPWLLNLFAENYESPNYVPQPVDPPPSEHPPTESQRSAIVMGASVPDYAMVLGPPGTGKTTVILSWVRHFVKLGKRVLVTSQNNRAVDNVLERLAKDDDLECVRIGNETRISSDLEDVLLDNKVRELQQRLFSDIKSSLAYLEQAGRFLQEVEASLEQVTLAQRRLRDADASLADCERSLRTTQSELAEAIRSREDTSAALVETRRRIDRLQNSSWPTVFEYVRKAATYLPLRFAHRSQKAQELHLVELEARIKYATVELERLQGVQSAAETESASAEKAYLDWFVRRPDDYVEEIRLPRSEDFSPYQLPEATAQIEALQEDLSLWHQKLTAERQQSLYPLLLEGVDVVGATCVGINTRALFRDIEFDVVIADESGQIQAHNLIVPLSRAPHAILVGDHKQLPPVVQEQIKEEIGDRGFDDLFDLYEKSLFELLWDRTPANRRVMLDEQFRCPSVIIDYVSKAFYDGEYYSGPGMDLKTAVFSFCPGPLVFIDTQFLPGHYESSTYDGSRSVINDNPVETRLVVELLEGALAERPELARQKEIAVIVPYRNHATRIQHAIGARRRRGKLSELDMPLTELVATIDSFQGQEKELVILPFTRSNRRGEVGFLRDWRRLNVALTRVKGQAIAIGDVKTLTSRSRHSRDEEFKRAMKMLVDHCDSTGCVVDARRILGKIGSRVSA